MGIVVEAVDRARRARPGLAFYPAMGFPVSMFPVLFAIGRIPGWLAQWQESAGDPEQKIARPRQIYVGEGLRHLNGPAS